MATTIHGESDDLIEFDGDVHGEVNFYTREDEATPCLLVCDDGTLLAVKYGKPHDAGLWHVELVKKGALFDRIDVCEEETSDGHSDVAHFRDGLKKIYAAKDWEVVH